MPKPVTLISTTARLDRKLRVTCALLESVAKRYPLGSSEQEAIREAAFALVYLHSHNQLSETYQSF